MVRWPNGWAIATPNFFMKNYKIKKLWAMWEVLDTIGQTEKKKNGNFGWVDCKN